MGNSVKARIAYVGSALENGEVEVRELLPALLAFADLVEHANRLLGGEHGIKVALNQDSFRHGSFDITLRLDTSVIEQAKIFFGLSSQVSLQELITLAGGVFSFMKWLRGRNIKQVSAGQNRSEVTLDDGDKTEVDSKVMEIFADVECRLSIDKILQPLERDGVEAFELHKADAADDDLPLETVRKDELQFFDGSSSPAPEQEAVCKILLISFDSGEWKFSNGDNSFWAFVRDEDFNAKIRANEISFACGDMLRLKYFTRQKLRNGTLAKETVVTKVTDVIRRPQVPLTFEQDK